MEEKKGNIILGIILAILMVVAIVIVIKNPNKTETVVETLPMNIKENVYIENQNENTQKINIEDININEEKEESMQTGGVFCKIDDQVVFYEETNKSIYLYNINDSKTTKLATLEEGGNKIYFDGKNVYCIPGYYMGKGIYKINLQGDIEKIYENSSLQLWLTEDKIYFVKQIGYDEINGNPQGTLCVMDKNGENIIEIAQNVKNNFYIQEKKIYYTTQDRKMYVINIDGTNQEELVQGRKFVINTFSKFILYIDYANQEAKHILNLETKEDNTIGYFGQVKKIQGKTYLNARKRADDGSLETEFTLFEINDSGTVKEYGKFADIGTNFKYIINGKAYIYNQEDGTYTINLENNEKEIVEDYKRCKYFLSGYGYKIDSSDLEDIKVEMIKL